MTDADSARSGTPIRLLVGVLVVLLVLIAGLAWLYLWLQDAGPSSDTAAAPRPDAAEVADSLAYPWDTEGVTTATQDGDEWSASGDAMVPLRGLTIGQVLEISGADEFDDQGDAVVRSCYVTAPGATSLTSPDAFARRFCHGGPLYVVAGQSELELWIEAPADSTWTVTVGDADLPVKTGTVTGTGDAVFAYVGEATTARISGGSDLMFVQAVTATTEKSLVDYEYIPGASVAWPDGLVTVFIVRMYGDASEWTIAIDDPAGG